MRFLRERTVFQPCDISPARRIRRTIDACTRVHVHVSYTCTRTRLVSKSPGPFIGESATGWASRKGVCWGWKGSVGEERCTVVFHSHYRNVLPCALVAPRNKSSVTVTMGGAQGGYRCWRGVPGVIVAPSSPPSNPRANAVCYVTVVTSFSSLSPVLTWDRSSKNRVPLLQRSRGDVWSAGK